MINLIELKLIFDQIILIQFTETYFPTSTGFFPVENQSDYNFDHAELS